MVDLENMKKFLIITSSTGNGDLLIMGKVFWDVLSQSNINLTGLDYSLCALGDKSYFNFCGAGKKVDARMAELFANRILKRQDCDRGIVGADEWAELAIEKLGY